MDRELERGVIDVGTAKGYDIAAAVRGPDNDSKIAQQLKALFTAPIRYTLGVPMFRGWSRKPGTPLSKLTDAPQDGAELFDACWDEWNNRRTWFIHYMDHIMRALAHFPELAHLRAVASNLRYFNRDGFIAQYEDLETTWAEEQ